MAKIKAAIKAVIEAEVAKTKAAIEAEVAKIEAAIEVVVAKIEAAIVVEVMPNAEIKTQTNLALGLRRLATRETSVLSHSALLSTQRSTVPYNLAN